MINAIQNLDMTILNAINNYCHTASLDKIMPLITLLGNVGMIWIVIAIALLISKKYRREGVMILAALLLSTILGEGILKHLVHRPRPCAGVVPSNLLIAKPLTYSFPSGHSASSFAAGGIIVANIKKYGVPAILLAVLIAFSRLYLYVHYPSDVVSGMLLGIACAVVVQNTFKAFSKNK